MVTVSGTLLIVTVLAGPEGVAGSGEVCINLLRGHLVVDLTIHSSSNSVLESIQVNQFQVHDQMIHPSDCTHIRRRGSRDSIEHRLHSVFFIKDIEIRSRILQGSILGNYLEK